MAQEAGVQGEKKEWNGGDDLSDEVTTRRLLDGERSLTPFFTLIAFFIYSSLLFGSVVDLYHSRSRFISIPRLQLAAPDLQERLRCNSLYSSHVFPGPR